MERVDLKHCDDMKVLNENSNDMKGRKLNISLILITLLYFRSPKHVGINTTHFLIMKIANKELP